MITVSILSVVVVILTLSPTTLISIIYLLSSNTSFGNLENKNDQVSEFESEMVNFGLKKNVASLENGFPVIVSVLRHFNEIGTMHSVLVVGFEKDEKGITGLYFNDPDTSIDQENKPVFVNLEVFTRAWRQLAIFIEK